MDLISIIVPVYGVEPYLDRCIQSIVNQTYSNLEIILVDDGSPDRCPEICDEWSKKDSRIKVIHKQNGGLSDARNAGVKAATGEYVAFVDSDDWIEIKFIEYLNRVIVKYDCDFSGCKYRKCENFCEYNHTEEELQAEIYDTISGLHALIDERVRQVVWNKLYKRSLIESINFEKGKCHEDEFWSYQVFANSKKYVEIDYVGYNYLQRQTSIMGEKYSLKRLDAVEAKVCRQIFLEECLPEVALQAKINLLFSCMGHGQAAITKLDMAEKEYVLTYLKRIIKEYAMKKTEYKGLKVTHKIWLAMAHVEFEMVCRVRNLLHIGE